MDCNAFICCGDFNTSFERSNGQTECLNSFITRNNLCISWNHAVSPQKIYIHKFIVKSIFLYRSYYFNKKCFDAIVENVFICDTLKISNHNIVYMSIAISNFANIVNVETCDIHVFNCAWRKATTEHKRQ